MKRSPDVLEFCETNLNSSISTAEIIVPDYVPLCRKHSRVRMHGLGVRSPPMEQKSSLEFHDDSFVCFRHILLGSNTCFSFIALLLSQHCSILDKILLQKIVASYDRQHPKGTRQIEED